MSTIEVVDLSSDDESENVIPKAVKLEPDFFLGSKKQNETGNGLLLAKYNRFRSYSTRPDSEENISSNAPSTGQSSSVLEQGLSPVDDSDISYASTICVAPLCRQFWKAGNYDSNLGSKVTVLNSKHYLHVHPMFLHSNATSHKWAFGAIAELLDNAVDDIQNGATFVIVDKTSNPKDGSPALLIQDDGAGMDPQTMRHCMSFGFSNKKSELAIGQYGNGFKTSTMRLGADVIVFSRHLNKGICTQSIGLLSYTYLVQTQLDRIVVPMVNYEFNTSTGLLKVLNDKDRFVTNLSLMLCWSPYSSEVELLQQFDDIGYHGTKVIIYNLWCNDDGNLELDFDTDPEDIRIAGDIKKVDTLHAWKEINEQHIAARFRYSLRVYMSILYLRNHKSFQMILRGKVVEPHNIVDDLKYPEYILYKPQVGGSVQGSIVTTIGFLKEAPQIAFHGFNVYHKSRLILPFWQVVRYLGSRGKGVVGILQADFIEPTHDKQDFEKTSLFQKLEVRLKEMTWEYWDCHCTLIGYKEKFPQPSLVKESSGTYKPVTLKRSSSPVVNNNVAYENSKLEKITMQSTSELGSHKRKTYESIDLPKLKKHALDENVTGVGFSQDTQVIGTTTDQAVDQETKILMEENKKLCKKCMEYEKVEEELNLKATKFRSEIQEANEEYSRLLALLKSLDVKNEP